MRRVLLTTFVSWLGLRLTEVALPLVALQQTGSVWATGLVAGSSGIALLTSPWWAARLRHRLTSGPALAAVLGVQAVGYLTVAVAAALDALTVVHLCVGGLIAGAATSVGGPATRALLADIGDRIGPGVAVRAVAWQDFAHRISMVVSPPVAALVVTQYGALPLMWAESVAVLVAAAVVVRVGTYDVARGTTESIPHRARAVLRAHPLVSDGIVMAAIGWFWWFAFALGLAILGAETGRPGQLIAAGMTGYGIGSLAGSATAPLIATRLPRVPTIVIGWMVLGAAFTSLPWIDGSLLALALVSAVGGFVTPLSLAALNALIIEHTSGPERRTAFATYYVASSGGSSVGMLCGGAVIGLLGAETTLHVGGTVMMAVPLVLLVRARSSRTPRGRRLGASTVDEAGTGQAPIRHVRAGRPVLGRLPAP